MIVGARTMPTGKSAGAASFLPVPFGLPDPSAYNFIIQEWKGCCNNYFQRAHKIMQPGLEEFRQLVFLYVSSIPGLSGVCFYSNTQIRHLVLDKQNKFRLGLRKQGISTYASPIVHAPTFGTCEHVVTC